MRWDFRNSWLVDLSSIVGGLIAIGGVLGKLLGNTAFMGPLVTSVPLWILLATLLLAPALTLLAAKRIIRPTDDDTKATVDGVRVVLESQIKDAESQLANAQVRLQEYETLENEILGYLASGTEISTIDLLSNLSIRERLEGRRLLLLAVASLEQKGKIVGTGGIQPKIKLAPKKPS